MVGTDEAGLPVGKALLEEGKDKIVQTKRIERLLVSGDPKRA